MKVEVKKSLCCGHAICLEVAPEIFDLGEDGKAFLLREVGPADEAETREAALECPARAIIITEETG